MKTYMIRLSYFKQGDDLHYFLEKESDVCKALSNHAKMLRESAAMLKNISNVVSKYNSSRVSIEADCHFITIEGPEEMLKELAEKELVEVDEFEDEEE